MKLFNLVLLAALLSFAAACGKDNKSGGGGGSKNYFGSISTDNLNANSITALNNYKAWYNSTTESFNGMAGLYALSYSNGGNQNNSTNCDSWGIFSWCWGSSYSSPSVPAASCKVAILMGTTTNIKPNNKLLARIANGTEGTLVNASQQGKVFQLQFQVTNQSAGNYGSLVTYVIDTNYHSALQPVMMSSQSSTSSLVAVTPTTNSSSLPFCD